MAFDLSRAWKVAQAVIGIADASRRALAPGPRSDDVDGLATGGLFGQLEARLTGVLVSALDEAFKRDAARLEIERAALEDQRRRAEEALRLELVRQAGDRALIRMRALGGLALVIWLVSVVFAMRFPEGMAGIGRIILALGWACLAGSLAGCVAASTAIARWLARAQTQRVSPEEVPEGGASAAAPWLVLGGLVLVGASLLVAL
jgi:hypothetical protein